MKSNNNSNNIIFLYIYYSTAQLFGQEAHYFKFSLNYIFIYYAFHNTKMKNVSMILIKIYFIIHDGII